MSLPIKLRLYARSESPESQNCGKLITGWFKDIGLDIDYQVIDNGALGDRQYNYDGKDYAPDFDMFIWGWGGDVDPNFILSVLTTNSIENWSDCIWSNAEYDKLFLQQQTTLDVQERIAIVKQMQQIVYDESPYIPLVYPLTSRRRTPARGPGGRARTRTRAPGGTTRSPTPTWRCTPRQRGGDTAAARTPAPSSAR